MPEQNTKDGIRHVPRRKRRRPEHPVKVLALVAAGLAGPVGLISGLVWLGRTFPGAFPCIMVGGVAAIFLAGLYMGLRGS